MRRGKPSRLSLEQIQALELGAERFNQGLYFEAHEDWEFKWRELPLPDRPQVQAAILVCGFFVLIQKKRLDPAQRLALLAMDRFAEAASQAKLEGLAPVLSLPDVEDRVLRMIARIRLGETDPDLLLSEAKGANCGVLKAR